MLLWHKEKMPVCPRAHKGQQLSCFTLQASPCHGEWFDWAWFVGLARSWSCVPKAERTVGRSCPFLCPTTDKEQPLYSVLLRESHFLTLGGTVNVPAKRERERKKPFVAAAEQPCPGYPSWRKASQACDWLGQLWAPELLEKGVSISGEHFLTGKDRRM